MFPQKLYGRCLRTLFAELLGKGHARAHVQPGKCTVENAVAVEVNFLAITGLEEAELTGRIDTHDRSRGQALMVFHLALRAADLILELPAGVFEGIVNGECEICMPLISRRRSFHIHLTAVEGSARRTWTS